MGWFGRVFLSLSRARTTRELLRVLCCADTSHARGMCLLREWLSPTQRAQFDSEGHFDVTGCDTGKRYRIRYGNASNVFELDENGNLGAGWCFVPYGTRVVGDVMLAQKLALEICESHTLAVANRLATFAA